MALAEPPVDTSATPAASSALASSISPVLSDTDSRARRIGRRPSDTGPAGPAVFCVVIRCSPFVRSPCRETPVNAATTSTNSAPLGHLDPFVQRADVVVVPHGYRPLRHDRAGIDPAVHQEHRAAGEFDAMGQRVRRSVHTRETPATARVCVDHPIGKRRQEAGPTSFMNPASTTRSALNGRGQHGQPAVPGCAVGVVGDPAGEGRHSGGVRPIQGEAARSGPTRPRPPGTAWGRRVQQRLQQGAGTRSQHHDVLDANDRVAEESPGLLFRQGVRVGRFSVMDLAGTPERGRIAVREGVSGSSCSTVHLRGPP